MDFHIPVIPPRKEIEMKLSDVQKKINHNAKKRIFDTGATRDTESGKLDYEGFMSPLVMKRYAEYLNGHRTMKDGSIRDSDNWQNGIPLDVYMKSEWRHHWDMWAYHRGWLKDIGDGFEDAMCAILFNVSGYLHERLKKSLAYRDSIGKISRAIDDALGEGGYNKSKEVFDQADLASQKSEGLGVIDHPF